MGTRGDLEPSFDSPKPRAAHIGEKGGVGEKREK